MEEITFDVNGILSPEEAERVFSEDSGSGMSSEENEGAVKTNNPTEEAESTEEPSEGVGTEEDINEENDAVVTSKGDSSSPNVYSSIATALKNDGSVFSDIEDEELEGIKTPEDFAEMFEKEVQNRLDERQRRIDEALRSGMNPDTVSQYEKTIQYLDSINDEVIEAEGEEADELRRQILYNDLVANRKYSHEKAIKEVEKSFKSGDDVEDAKDALQSLKEFYTNGYNQIREEAKKQAENEKRRQAEEAERIKKMILEDEMAIGDTKLDKKTCQKIYDALSKPVFKDEHGRLLTAIQKFQRDNPSEFLKQIGMWYVLTDGGKNLDKIIKSKITQEKNKNIRELSSKINTTTLRSDGSLSYATRNQNDADPLLSDKWKIGVNG